MDQSQWPPRTDWAAYEAVWFSTTGGIAARTDTAQQDADEALARWEPELPATPPVPTVHRPGWLVRTLVASEVRHVVERTTSLSPHEVRETLQQFRGLRETQQHAIETEIKREAVAPPPDQPRWLRRVYLDWLAGLDRRQCASCRNWDGLIEVPAWHDGFRTWRCTYCLEWDQRADLVLPPAI